MKNISNIFFDKKILIYGLGKSGVAAFKFLKKYNNVFLYDDFHSNIKVSKFKKYLVNYKQIPDKDFDKIILSPGIDINKCKLSKFLKKNYNKVHSDLDVFYAFYKNDCITITGTNGKSTTCQLMYEALLNQKFDVRLVGNIGNPILNLKNIKKKTIFVIEASSYQLEYSKYFRSKYSVILNLAPDHLERHKTLNNYINAKFRLLKNQIKGDLAFINKNDYFISKKIKRNKYKSKLIKVDTKKISRFIKQKYNYYFFTRTNKENLSFVLDISKKINLKKDLLNETIKNFKGLKYRQQVVFQKKNITIINDSKSTSFSSSIDLLKSGGNIYWILGGVNKKGDKLKLSKKDCKNVKAFIFGKNKKFFTNKLKGKIEYKCFLNLKDTIKKVFDISKEQKVDNKIILFSPSAASFDSFLNFEDRGLYFNKIIKKYKWI